MVQVPDEMLEIIDKDRRLANDWAGLSNDEKQLMIDNYQPEQAYDNKLMRSQALGEFIGTYNRATKSPEPTWFSEEEARLVPEHTRQVPPEERPRGSPSQIEHVEEELVIPTGGMKLDELKFFIAEYNKLSEDKKREVLKRVDKDTIQLIKDYQPKAKWKDSWRIINSLVEDWLQTHKEGALQEEGPLRGLFSPEELEDVKGLKTLGEEFKPSPLTDLLNEWEQLIQLKGGKLDAFDEMPAMPILIRMANEIGKKAVSENDLINENFIHNEFEEELERLFHQRDQTSSGKTETTLEEFKKDLTSKSLENIFLEFTKNKNKGVLQWGILQDLVHKRHRLVFSAATKAIADDERIKRWDSDYERSREQTISELHSNTQGRIDRSTQLTQTVEPKLSDWQLQLQTYRGRTSSSKAYAIPLYLVVHPNNITGKLTNMFEDVDIQTGDWFITCGKGVIIYWSKAIPKQFKIYDNDSDAILTLNIAELMYADIQIKQQHNLRDKLNSIKNSPRSGEKWNDILEVVEKLLKISEKPESDTKFDSPVLRKETVKIFEEYWVKHVSRNRQFLSNLVNKTNDLFDSFMDPIIKDLETKRIATGGNPPYWSILSIDIPTTWYKGIVRDLRDNFKSDGKTPLTNFMLAGPIFNEHMDYKGHVAAANIKFGDGEAYDNEEFAILQRDLFTGYMRDDLGGRSAIESALYNEFASQLQLWFAENSDYELKEE